MPTGGRRRKTVYGRTREEVHAKLTGLLHQVHQGIPSPDNALTVAAYLSSWLNEVMRRQVRPRTWDVYETVVRVHIVPTLGNKKLAKLTPSDVRRLLNSKQDAGLKPGTVKKIHVVLGSALQQAVRDDLISRNVVRNVRVSVPTDEPVQPLDHDEARKMLACAADDRLYAFWAVAVGVGLRRGEALGLRWSDIDLRVGTLSVARTLQVAEGRLHLTAPKTQRSRRTIPLPDVCRQALVEHQERQQAEVKARGAVWDPAGFVFTMPDGSPIPPRNVNRWMDALCKRASIRRIRVHDLRHTCASLLLAQGVAPRVVMEVLGHSQIGVTMNTYAHVLPVLQQDAAERMHAALGGSVAVNSAVISAEQASVTDRKYSKSSA